MRYWCVSQINSCQRKAINTKFIFVLICFFNLAKIFLLFPPLSINILSSSSVFTFFFLFLLRCSLYTELFNIVKKEMLVESTPQINDYLNISQPLHCSDGIINFVSLLNCFAQFILKMMIQTVFFLLM